MNNLRLNLNAWVLFAAMAMAFSLGGCSDGDEKADPVVSCASNQECKDIFADGYTPIPGMCIENLCVPCIEHYDYDPATVKDVRCITSSLTIDLDKINDTHIDLGSTIMDSSNVNIIFEKTGESPNPELPITVDLPNAFNVGTINAGGGLGNDYISEIDITLNAPNLVSAQSIFNNIDSQITSNGEHPASENAGTLYLNMPKLQNVKNDLRVTVDERGLNLPALESVGRLFISPKRGCDITLDNLKTIVEWIYLGTAYVQNNEFVYLNEEVNVSWPKLESIGKDESYSVFKARIGKELRFPSLKYVSKEMYFNIRGEGIHEFILPEFHDELNLDIQMTGISTLDLSGVEKFGALYIKNNSVLSSLLFSNTLDIRNAPIIWNNPSLGCLNFCPLEPFSPALENNKSDEVCPDGIIDWAKCPE